MENANTDLEHSDGYCPGDPDHCHSENTRHLRHHSEALNAMGVQRVADALSRLFNAVPTLILVIVVW